jgi:ATP-dependent helicase/nuclease subunit A
VLDALLIQALNYETVEPPSLQGFLRYIRASQSDIKREAEEASTGVRIMTVHGAKGLEADVVFLADTGSQIVHPSHRAVLVDVGGPDDPAFLWRRPAKDATELQKAADEKADAEASREYLRLLYVAMTRARDVLYVCGIRGEKKDVEGCWYSLVERALVPEGTSADAETGELLAPNRGRSREASPVPKTNAGEERRRLLLGCSAAPPLPRRRSRCGRRARFGRTDPRGFFARSESASGAELGLVPRPACAQAPAGQRRTGAPSGGSRRQLLRRELPGCRLAEAIRREVDACWHAALGPSSGRDARAEAPIVGHVETERGAMRSGAIDRLLRDHRLAHPGFKTNRGLRIRETMDRLPCCSWRFTGGSAGLEPGVPVEAGMWTAEPKSCPFRRRHGTSVMADWASRHGVA